MVATSGPAEGGQTAALRAVMVRVLDTHVLLPDGSCTGCSEAPCTCREAALSYFTGLEFGDGMRAVRPEDEE